MPPRSQPSSGPSRLEVLRLLEVSPMGMAIVSAGGTILFSNTPLSRMSGIPRNMLQDRDLRLLIVGANREACIEQVLGNASRSGETLTEIHRLGGADLPVLLRWQETFFQGEPARLLWFESLPARYFSEEMLTKLFNFAPLPMVLCGWRSGAIQMVNRRATELFFHGRRIERVRVQDIIGTETWRAFRTRLQDGGYLDDFEVMALTAYGESFYSTLSGQVLHIGKDDCILIGFTDITERKQAEEELRQAKALAVKATEVKSLFLATMSHEIRTPMNGVLGMLDVFATSDLNGEQAEMIDVVRNSARTLLAIIDDILDLSKIEAGRLKLEDVWLSLRDTIETTIELLASKAHEKGVELAWVVPPDLPDRLKGDPTRLRQILLNLLSNAVKFTARGRIAVRATQVERNGTALLRIEVEDSGIGLSSEQQSRLFEPFSQADATTTRRFGGTGLGLSICRKLVDMMGGDIGVTSSEGRGACFWFEVPLRSEAAEQEPPALDLGGMSVLVADDLDEARQGIAAILTEFGAIAEEAANEDQALTMLGGREYDLVLYDNDGGFEALHQYIASSAHINALAMSLTHDSTPSTLIAKPIRRAHLVRGIALSLGRIALDAARAPARFDRTSLRVPPTIEEAEASNRLILVAEDNFTNRLVIGKQLTRLGYAYEIAEDGEAAWDALMRRKIALLLTDCSMPRLDGYGLTARLRAREAKVGGHLPVIALTAHALDSDRDKCLQAGMDDYLSKPIALDKLDAVLQGRLPFGDRDAAVTTTAVLNDAPEPVEEPVEELPVDLPALAELLGDDDPAVLREILASFLESYAELKPGLDGAISGLDHQTLRAVSHACKGAARNACARPLATALAELESAARDCLPQDEIGPLFARTVKAHEAVRAFIDAQF